MEWYRTGPASIEGDFPELPFHCGLRCECPEMWWRSKVIQRRGAATVCSININDFDSEQEGLYRRLNVNVTGRWKRASNGEELKSCSSSGLFTSVDGNVPECEADAGGTFECEPPAICSTVACIYEEETTYSGENEVTESTAVSAARAVMVVDDPDWAVLEWSTGYPTAPGRSGSVDVRNAPGASFTEHEMRIQFAGSFRPFLLRRKETHTYTNPVTFDTSTSELVIDLEVMNGEELVIEWAATANTRVTLNEWEILHLV